MAETGVCDMVIDVGNDRYPTDRGNSRSDPLQVSAIKDNGQVVVRAVYVMFDTMNFRKKTVHSRYGAFTV